MCFILDVTSSDLWSDKYGRTQESRCNWAKCKAPLKLNHRDLSGFYPELGKVFDDRNDLRNPGYSQVNPGHTYSKSLSPELVCLCCNLILVTRSLRDLRF